MNPLVSVDSCTLPTAERPLRAAEFEALFRDHVRSTTRDGSAVVLALDPAAAGVAADLAVRETSCCSFFTFTLVMTGDGVTLRIDAPRPELLDALVAPS